MKGWKRLVWKEGDEQDGTSGQEPEVGYLSRVDAE
jgi:hypothetical protein